MLKFFYILLLFYGISSSCWAQLPSNFPLYHEVVEHLIEKGTCYVKINSSTRLNIHKDTKGFWLTLARYQADRSWDYEDKQLIWSPEGGFALHLIVEGEYKKQSIEATFLKKRPFAVEDALLDEYNVNLFYGMDSWTDNVINYYRKYTATTPEDYYSLGRAHSFKGSQYFLEHGSQYLLDNPKLIEEFVAQEEKAIACFKKTHELNPDFQTIVGGIYTKYCNEIMTLNLRFAGLNLKKEALAAIQDKELYTAATQVYSKNILESCPKNALLFTCGDNDTYPLLYMQQAKNIRPDVLLINESQLNLDYYLNHLRSAAYYGNSHLQLSLSPKAYEGRNNEYIHLDQNQQQEPYSISTLIHLLEEETPVGNIHNIPASSFVLGQKGKIVLSSSEEYLVRASFLLLIIIEENHDKRPITFAPSYGYSSNNIAGRSGAKEKLYMYGLNHLFVAKAPTRNKVNKTLVLNNYDVFMEQLEWPVFESVTEENRSSFSSTVYAHLHLIHALIGNNELEKARTLHNKWYQNFYKVYTEMPLRAQLAFIEFSYTLKEEQAEASLAKFMTYLLNDFPKKEVETIKISLLPKIKELLLAYENEQLMQQLLELEVIYYP